MKLTPYPYQKEGVLLLEKCGGRTLLADETGLGKTLQDLLYLKRNNKWPAVVVCPAIAKYTWEREAAKWIGVRALVLEGRKPKPFGRLHKERLIIINYDILGPWVPALRKLGLASVTLDESHYLTNPKTQRTQNVLELCKGVEHIRGLSATPMVNRPIELFPTLSLLWPAKFPNRFAYGYRYCNPSRRFGRLEFKGARRLKELRGRLQDAGVIRRLKKDVLKDLPALTRVVVPLPLHDPDGEYKSASRDFMGWLRGKDKAAAHRAKGNTALIRMGYLKRLAARLKYRAAAKWVDEFLSTTGEKIILFAWHKDMIENLHKRYKGHCVVIDGNTPAKQRDIYVQAFQRNKEIKVFIGNLQAASSNITLTAASMIAMLELDPRPGIMIQAEGRPHRIGQHFPVTASYLVAHGTIEERLCDLIQTKQQHINTVMDGGEGMDLDIMDVLLEEMYKEAGNGQK